MKSIILVLILATVAPAAAEVVESTANGFAVRNTAEIAAHPFSGTLGPLQRAVLAGQLQRLKHFVETGRPE